MRTITIEEHFIADGFKEALQKRGIRPGYSDEVQAKMSDLGASRLRDMDVAGIDFQVISHTMTNNIPLSVEENISLTQGANDQLATAVAAHPDRFAGFALLPMNSPEAAANELERTVRKLGFKGPMINGTTNGRFLDDPFFLPVLERANALDVPIYLHPAEPPTVVRDAYYTGFDPAVGFALSANGWGWHSEVAIHSLRMILAGVFDRFPNLQIIIGHMGEMIPFMLDRINNTLGQAARNLHYRVPEYFLRNFFVTTSGFFTDPPLLLTMEVMGADRIIFSVDYPYSTNEQGRRFLDNIAISPQDKEKISYLNVEKLLKLSQEMK